MNATDQPLVSILTPVFNEEEFLAECIESVLAQTYSHWDYTIVNNVSNDQSLAVAQKYAARDPRIRIINNHRFLSVVENHNHTIHQVSPDSKYCKFVFADDWLYPNCLEQMVQLAERNPSVGVVGAYTMDGHAVRWRGPQYPSHCIAGREICRRQLLGGPYVFGTMTSLLVRSDLVQRRPVFFNEHNLQADMEACFDLLQESDFGFIHQVLSFGRERERVDFFAANMNSHRLGDFVIFLKYGPSLLKPTEYNRRWKVVRRDYHRVLAHNVLRLRPKQFWQYHRDTLAAFGGRIDPWLLGASVIAELAGQLLHPITGLKRGWRWWSSRVRKADRERVEKYRQSQVQQGVEPIESA
jgi:glycosyltransferase involved in cell wall biosynthesis